MAGKTKPKITLAGPPVHDRRAAEVGRNVLVGAIEVDDPLAVEPGDKIVTLRNLRDDPLGRLHDRKQIDDAQFSGGRAYQRDFEKLERGPRAIDPSKEYVDGGKPPEGITDGMVQASKNLKRADGMLGTAGTSYIHQFLILGYTMAQISQSRGQNPTEAMLKYYGARIRDDLETLAIAYGFAAKPTRG